MRGKDVKGTWENDPNIEKTRSSVVHTKEISKDPEIINKVRDYIQRTENSSPPDYNLYSHNCYHERDKLLSEVGLPSGSGPSEIREEIIGEESWETYFKSPGL